MRIAPQSLRNWLLTAAC